MFDQLITTILIAAGLTDNELKALSAKLFDAGQNFFGQGEAIGQTALYLNRSGKMSPLTSEWKALWDVRAPLVEAMDEMYDLMREVNRVRFPELASA